MKYLFGLVCATTFLSHAHEQADFLKSLIPANALVFDIGACIGSKADIFLVAGAGRVICVEPQPYCINILQEKYKNNPHVAVIPVGIANKAGILELGICEESLALTTFSTEWQEKSRYSSRHDNKWDKKIMVPVITLDQLIERYGVPSFCKIDVENFEYEVLAGLSQPIPSLVFEFHEETMHNTIRCMEHLTTLSAYEFNITLGDIPHLVSPCWLSAAELTTFIKHLSTTNRFGELLCGDVYARFLQNKEVQ